MNFKLLERHRTRSFSLNWLRYVKWIKSSNYCIVKVKNSLLQWLYKGNNRGSLHLKVNMILIFSNSLEAFQVWSLTLRNQADLYLTFIFFPCSCGWTCRKLPGRNLRLPSWCTSGVWCGRSEVVRKTENKKKRKEEHMLSNRNSNIHISIHIKINFKSESFCQVTTKMGLCWCRVKNPIYPISFATKHAAWWCST